jgi:O-antigen/teichoic acid export membrane protein
MNSKLVFIYAKVFLARGVAAFGSFILTFAVASLSSAEILGNFSLGIGVILWLSTIARFGSDHATLRFGSIAWAARDWSRFRSIQLQGAGLSVVLGMGLGLVLFVFAETISLRVFSKPELVPLMRTAAFVIPVFPLIVLQSAWLRAAERPTLSPLFEMGAVSFVTAAFIALLSTFDFELGAVPFLTSFGCATVVVFFMGMLYVALIERTEKAKRDCTPSQRVGRRWNPQRGFFCVLPDYALGSIVGSLSQWGLLLMFGVFAESASVGQLSLVLRLCLIINVVLSVASAVVVPKLATLYAEEETSKLQGLLQKTTLWICLLAAPATLSFIFAPGLWLGLFGPEYASAAPALQMLAVAQFVNAAFGPVGSLLFMTGHQKIMRNIFLIVNGIGIGMAFFLMPTYGLWGAILSISFILVAQNVVAAYMVKKHLDIRTFPRRETLGGVFRGK